MGAWIADHMWQSTLFAMGVAVVGLALRRHRAGIRFWLWFAASVKFLVPFAALVTLGQQLAWRPVAPSVEPAVALISEITQPFAPFVAPAAAVPLSATASSGTGSQWPVVLGVIWMSGTAVLLVTWWRRWRRLTALLRHASAIEHGRELGVLRRVEQTLGTRSRIPLVSMQSSCEPCVVGAFRPVLLWPRGIGDHLSDAQLEAIFVHELSHVRRLDNLSAAVHMVVQSIFWFHPVVWWIGERMVEERERACDEEVIRLGSEPHVYAEGILKTCEHFVESSLLCAAGVTGSDLKRRIVGIMRPPSEYSLSRGKQLLLSGAGASAIALPLLFGASQRVDVRAQTQTRADSPKFEVASIKPNKAGTVGVRMQVLPGGRFSAMNVTLRQLVREAYRMENARITGGPAWIAVETFDVVAKAADGYDISDPFSARASGIVDDPLALMLPALLAERFKLATHVESREMPIYALVLARSDGRLGPQIQKSTTDCVAIGRAQAKAPPPEFPASGRPPCGIRMGPGTIAAGGASMGQLVNLLPLGRTIVDKTGLTGTFDFDLRWTPDLAGKPGDPPPAPAVDSAGASVFTALQEQLGLKAEAQRGPVDVLVIDHAERPTEN